MRPDETNKAPATATFLYPKRLNTGPPKKDKSIPNPWFNTMIRVPSVAVRPVSSKASWKTKPKPAMSGSTTTYNRK